MCKYFKLFLLSSLLAVMINSTTAQEKKKIEFGKGIRYMAKDSSYYMRFSVRAQNRMDVIHYYDNPDTKNITDDPVTVSRFYIKRARLKFDGFAYSPKVTYKFEFDVVGGYVRDAWIKWNFYKNLSVQYGLGKLPSNRERVVSSQKLQFVDRSQLNGSFTWDRDQGFWLHHHFKLGKALIRETLAYTDGRGINDFSAHEGASYTGRIDLLPFGAFSRKGDFFFADFAREKTPKLMLGGAYNYNDKAINSRGQIGRTMAETRNLSSVMADMMFKYRGWTLFGEFAHKVAVDSTPVAFYKNADDSLVLGSFYTGYGYNAQIGYLFKRNWEISGRYTAIIPEEETGNTEVYDYTFGISKYIVEHNLKVQSDITYRDNNVLFNDTGEQIIFRFQVDLAF